MIIMPPARSKDAAFGSMFEVSGDETIRLAAAQGLTPVLQLRTDSVQEVNRRAGVTWTRLAFVKDGGWS